MLKTIISAVMLQFVLNASGTSVLESVVAECAAGSAASSSSSSRVATFEKFQKISRLDELPAFLDKVTAHYNADGLTRVLFLDFDDCMAQRLRTVDVLGTTYQFNWISSPERPRQLASTLQGIVGDALDVNNHTWAFVSEPPTVNEFYEDAGSVHITYQPVSNLSTIITELKARNFVVKVCSGLAADSQRLEVLTKIGLTSEDYLYANTRKVTKAAAMLNYVLGMRKQSDGKKNNYLTVLVDNYFPDEKDKTGSSQSELAEAISKKLAKINRVKSDDESGSDSDSDSDESKGAEPLTVESLFVHDTRFENAIQLAKPQIRSEIILSLEAKAALLNVYKAEDIRISEAQQQNKRKVKFKIKKLRQKLAKASLISNEKQKQLKRTDLKKKLSEAKLTKKLCEDSILGSQRKIVERDKEIEAFARLLADFRRSA